MEALTVPVSTLGQPATVSGRVAAGKAINKAAFEKTAKDFEAVFMAQMIKPMWDGIKTDGMFGGGSGEEAMRDLLMQEYGKSMVRNDGYGLSDAIMNEMIRLQEKANNSGIGGANG